MEELRQSVEMLRDKVQPLVDQVKEGEYATSDGISYLEVKHILLWSYCEHLTFLILLKAEGKPLNGHPVLERLAEIRMFLEKTRPLDKKLNYQIDKLLKQAKALETGQALAAEKDDLKYKPNPDLLVSKLDASEEQGGFYKPPKIAPLVMDGDEEDPKERRSKLRAEKQFQERSKRSTYLRDLQNDMEGRPEEISLNLGADDKALRRQIEKLDARARAEEDMFARVPLNRDERKRLKKMKRSRSGLVGMMDDFEDEVGGLIGNEGRDATERPAPPRPKKGSKNSLGVKKPKSKFKKTKGRK